MDPNTLKALQGAAGAAGGDTTKYVEEVFSTDVYAGNGSSRTITNEIDLDGEGGLVWTKMRTDASYWHALTDTERGVNEKISTDRTDEEATNADSLTSFNSNGFSVGAATSHNDSGYTYVNWTFRKAPGFFDVVTYPGTGSAKTVAHNLGCVPGMIIVKALDVDEAWAVYHKSTGNTKYFSLSEATGEQTSTLRWNDTSPTDTVFTIGTDPNVNQDTKDYVAYLFADGDDTDAQIFGDDEDEAIIKCGTFTTSSSKASVNLGFEPQWVMFKGSSGTSPGNGWEIYNSMTGLANGSYTRVSANSNAVEVSGAVPVCTATATGFEIENTNNTTNFIYMAIRRGPMKTPEDATKVFAIDYGNGSTNIPNFDSGFPVDFAIAKVFGSSDSHETITRLTGNKALKTDDDVVEVSNGANWVTDSNVGWAKVDYSTTRISWMWQRAPGFFDVVAYDGTGSIHTEAHNLGVVPEMMIFKCRDQTENWAVYHKDLTSAGHHVLLNLDNDESTNSATWNSTDPTASVFTVGNDNYSNGPTETYVAYLFASCPGVSKVGTYDGDSDSTIPVDCGFTAGARFVLIKRTNEDQDWYLFDSVRGITTGSDDPYLLLNEPDAQVTTADRLDSNTSGFTVRPYSDAGGALNEDGGTYIYLAIA
jgi:hypothetical protein